jgi:hypothetical protein
MGMNGAYEYILSFQTYEKEITMKNDLLVTKLSSTFNAEAADVKAVLNKYGAEIRTMGFGRPERGNYFKLDVVDGVQEKDQEAFLKEFKALKGVEGAHTQPFPCFPF